MLFHDTEREQFWGVKSHEEKEMDCGEEFFLWVHWHCCVE